MNKKHFIHSLVLVSAVSLFWTGCGRDSTENTISDENTISSESPERLDDNIDTIEPQAASEEESEYLSLRLSDEDIPALEELLKAVPQLRELDLRMCHKIEGAGLEYLKDLSQLNSLHMLGLGLTDAGMVHLKGLTKLETLDLTYRITDAGLVESSDTVAVPYFGQLRENHRPRG